jgi:LysM repeat protein
MAFWRRVSKLVTCATLMGILGGCTPPPSSPVDEQKEPHFLKARNLEVGYDYAGAIEAYHLALGVNPRNSEAHYRLGLLYENNDRDPAAAIYHFERFLWLRPTSEHATVIRQRILGCKQELAKEVSLGVVSGEMKKQLDGLIAKNQDLAEKNQRLEEANKRLQDLLSRTQSVPTAHNPAAVSSTTPPVSVVRSPTPSPSPPPPAGSTHTVQRGETYYSIAKRYSVSTTALQAANPGVNPNRLTVGQRLNIPRR